MIKSVTVINHLNQSMDIVLGDPDSSGFLIYDITGIGPPKATINTTQNASGDGNTYNSAKVGERNIVIMMKFVGDDIESVRQKTYKYFPLKKEITFIVETDNRRCSIHGHVESNEPVIFSQEEYTQISIICPSPYFEDVGEYSEVTTIFYGVEPLFEFPFFNDSLTVPLMVIDNINQSEQRLITYQGDADVGVVIQLKALGPVKNVNLYNTGTREVMKLDSAKLIAMTGSGIIVGDEIVLTTLRENKTIYLLRNGVYINILNCLDRFTEWFTLVKGDNIFAYTAEEGASNLMVTISHRTLYEGV